MKILEIFQQIENLNRRSLELHRRVEETSMPTLGLLPEALQELQIALEELRVVEEELRQQNENLLAVNESVKAERQRYQELFELAPNGYLVTTPEGAILEANQAAAQMLNVRQRFLIGKPLATFVSQKDLRKFSTKLSQTSHKSKAQSWEIALAPRGGEPLNVEMMVAIGQSSQQRLQLRWLLHDLSDRQKIEAQLRSLNAELARRAKFEAALNRIIDKVRASLDKDQILQTAVREITHLFEIQGCDVALYDREQQTSTVCHTYSTIEKPPFFSDADCPIPMTAFPEGYRQLLQRQQFQFCEIAADSTRSRISILACPIDDAQGVLGDFWLFHQTGTAFDAAEIALVRQVAHQCAIALRQSHLYQESQTQVARLDRLNRLKDDFLSTVSHEMRTPITNMKMAIQMLQLAKSPEQQQRYLEILQKECDREASLINDFLDMNRLEEADYPRYLNEAIDLHEWLPIILKPIQIRAQSRQQTLMIDLPADCPPLISDRSSLRRILVELLTNAYKYTREGGQISLSVDWINPSTALLAGATEPDAAPVVVFTIQNQAEIPTKELPYIFDKFYRIPEGDPWQQGGTGLGLALVQQLLKQLQGTIQVESSHGWTTFTVRLSTKLSDFPQKSIFAKQKSISGMIKERSFLAR
jgi:PAS domain S-box-containing protein